MKNRKIIFVILLAVILFGIYWKTFNYELIWDDKILIRNNFLLQEDYPLIAAFKYGYLMEQMGLNKEDYYYRPIVSLSFILEKKLWGIHDFTLKLVNVLIYYLALIVIYRFFTRQSDKNNFPEIATLIFALYPLNVDNIVWVVGRCDLFMLLWGALALLFLDTYSSRGKPQDLALSSVFFVFGLLSKETIVFLIPILIIYDLVKSKRIAIPYHAANIGLTLLCFLLRNRFMGIRSLKYEFFASPVADLAAFIQTVGYYARSLFFPLHYDMFLPLADIFTSFYLVVGSLFLLLAVIFLYRSLCDRELLLPLALILCFLAGSSTLVFAVYYPFKVYSRYMMIPALGVSWLAAKAICRFQERTRGFLALALLVAFIPSVILNAYSYKDEIGFWTRVDKALPHDPYALIQLAQVYYNKKSVLKAEVLLNRALGYPIQKSTAVLIASLYADIEFARKDYDKLLRWIDSFRGLEDPPYLKLGPSIVYGNNFRLALYHIATGNTVEAERLLRTNISIFPNRRDNYEELYRMFVGYEIWDKAGEMERVIKGRFPISGKALDTEGMKEKIVRMTPEEKIGHFTRYRNYGKAINLAGLMTPLDDERRMKLASLYYHFGRPKEAEESVSRILEREAGLPETFNKIGYFYLTDFARAREAVYYFEKSLALKRDQPEIASLVISLTVGYLNKIRDVWEVKPPDAHVPD
jgi:tetratricopeptide (TPR) repeat protein